MGLDGDIPVLNGKVLEELRSLETRLRKPKLIANALDKLRQTAPGLFAQMHAGMAARDARAISAAGHALGSSSSALGAMRIRALCERLDLLGADDPLDGIPDLLGQLEAEYKAAVEAVEEFIKAKRP